jgi:hypothetical protein
MNVPVADREAVGNQQTLQIALPILSSGLSQIRHWQMDLNISMNETAPQLCNLSCPKEIPDRSAMQHG